VVDHRTYGAIAGAGRDFADVTAEVRTFESPSDRTSAALSLLGHGLMTGVLVRGDDPGHVDVDLSIGAVPVVDAAPAITLARPRGGQKVDATPAGSGVTK